MKMKLTAVTISANYQRRTHFIMLPAETTVRMGNVDIKVRIPDSAYMQLLAKHPKKMYRGDTVSIG